MQLSFLLLGLALFLIGYVFLSYVKRNKQVAEQGDADAQFLLGGMYEHGQGVTQNSQQAFGWYQKAAEQGDAKAQSFLEGRGRRFER